VDFEADRTSDVRPQPCSLLACRSARVGCQKCTARSGYDCRWFRLRDEQTTARSQHHEGAYAACKAGRAVAAPVGDVHFNEEF
jgi:hypothetical protein